MYGFSPYGAVAVGAVPSVFNAPTGHPMGYGMTYGAWGAPPASPTLTDRVVGGLVGALFGGLVLGLASKFVGGSMKKRAYQGALAGAAIAAVFPALPATYLSAPTGFVRSGVSRLLPAA